MRMTSFLKFLWQMVLGKLDTNMQKNEIFDPYFIPYRKTNSTELGFKQGLETKKLLKENRGKDA